MLQEKLTADSGYQLLLVFDQLYGSFTEIEKKKFMQALIEKIELYPEKQPDGHPNHQPACSAVCKGTYLPKRKTGETRRWWISCLGLTAVQHTRLSGKLSARDWAMIPNQR